MTDTAVYGSGYVAGQPMAMQVPEVVEARPQLVVVTGGRADLDEDPGAVRDAAGRLYTNLRARLSGATIVVIGPMWLGADPTPDERGARLDPWFRSRGGGPVRRPLGRQLTARDLDIGVLTEADELLDLGSAVVHLATLTGFDRIDVVHLNRGGPLIRERALVGSVGLYESEPAALATAQMAAMAERVETDPMRRLNLRLLAG